MISKPWRHETGPLEDEIRGAPHFIDTSVFIYHLDTTDPRKHGVAERIVREALAAGCRTLTSEELQHGQGLGTLTVIDPFR